MWKIEEVMERDWYQILKILFGFTVKFILRNYVGILLGELDLMNCIWASQKPKGQ